MTTPLSYLRPLYVEQQSAGRAFPRSRFVVAGVAVLLILALLTARLFIPYRIWLALVPGITIGAITVGIAAILMSCSSGTTIVEPAVIQLRLSVFGLSMWKRTIAIDELRGVDISDMTGQLAVLKWGVGELRFMTRKRCVRLHLRQYRYVVIGSDEPEKLKAAIDQTLATTPAPQSVSSN